MKSVLSLLKSVFGRCYSTSKGNYAFRCPFEPCISNPKYDNNFKLEIHPDTGHWHCWVCGKAGYNLMAALKAKKAPANYFKQLADLLPDKKYRFLHKTDDYEKKTHVELPKEYKPLWKPGSGFFYETAKDYLINDRGLTEDDIFKYRIGYTIKGPYGKMIVIPNYDKHGKLNYFATRSYLKNSRRKFKNPPIDRDVIGFELQLNWNLPLILTESALDAITVKRNGSPLYGKTLSDSIKRAIFLNDVTDLFICLDPDAIQNAMSHANYFMNYGVNVRLVEFPENTDVNELGYLNTWNMIENTSISSSMDLFEKEVRYRL